MTSPPSFPTPTSVPWGPINWPAIDLAQIFSVAPELFLELLTDTAEVKSRINSHSKESWDYLQSCHPQTATFLSGTYEPDKSTQIVGIWEKEERQHTPALQKIYQQLTGQTLPLTPNTVEGYHPSSNTQHDIYHHLVSRLSSEWSAISRYPWLMAHSTGALQQSISHIM